MSYQDDIVNAMVGGITQSMNPMNGMVVTMLGEQTKGLKIGNAERISGIIDALGVRRQKEEQANASTAVLDDIDKDLKFWRALRDS